MTTEQIEEFLIPVLGRRWLLLSLFTNPGVESAILEEAQSERDEDEDPDALLEERIAGTREMLALGVSTRRKSS